MTAACRAPCLVHGSTAAALHPSAGSAKRSTLIFVSSAGARQALVPIAMKMLTTCASHGAAPRGSASLSGVSSGMLSEASSASSGSSSGSPVSVLLSAVSSKQRHPCGTQRARTDHDPAHSRSSAWQLSREPIERTFVRCSRRAPSAHIMSAGFGMSDLRAPGAAPRMLVSSGSARKNGRIRRRSVPASEQRRPSTQLPLD